MRFTPFLSFLPMAVSALAQTQSVQLVPLPARGWMPAFQAGMTFSHAPDTIVRKLPNLPVQLGTFAPGGANSPDYDLNDIEAWFQAQTSEEIDFEVDAMSSGNDVLPVVYDMESLTFMIRSGQSNGWATLFLSGIDPANQDTGVAVYGYYFDNPSFPSGLQKKIYHEIVRADYAAGPLAPPSGASIVGLDINMGLIQSNLGFRETPVLPEVEKLYFSLTPASADSLRAAGLVPAETDGATILVAVYNPTTGQLATGLPVPSVGVHRHGADLGVPEGANVDALGVATVTVPAQAQNATQKELVPQTMLYLISLDDNQGGGEELFVSATHHPNVQQWGPLRTDDGLGLVGPTGRLTIRVKGACAQDPDAPRGAYSHGIAGVDEFTAGGTMPVVPSTMNLSVTAIGKGTTTDTFKLHGVLSGGNYSGTAVIGLYFEHETSSFFTILPDRRPAGNQPFTFWQEIDIPWQIPPGYTTGLNEYDVVVLSTPVSGSGFEVSNRVQLRRVQH